MKLITIIKVGEPIEKGLKRYKQKINKLNLIKYYKEKQYYIKPSKIKRLKKFRKLYLIKKKIYENN